MYMDVAMTEMKIGMGRILVKFLKEEGEWRLPGLLYADDLVCVGSRKKA